MNLAIVALLAFNIFVQPGWELKKEKDGIKVYLADSDQSKIKKFKVNAFVNATPNEIAKAVIDLENNYKWFVDVEQATLLKQVEENEFIFKQVIKVPFPFSDREVVERCVFQYLPNERIRIDISSANSFIPENDEYVRMPIATGYWILSPSGNGTQVEYSFLADPGGDIPAWLANQFIVNNPIKTIKGLREYLQK